MFQYPIEEAARVLQVGVTVVKKSCRTHGFTRWPWRKLSCLRNIRDAITSSDGCIKSRVLTLLNGETLDSILQKIDKNISQIQKSPETDLDTIIPRIRQLVYKVSVNIGSDVSINCGLSASYRVAK